MTAFFHHWSSTTLAFEREAGHAEMGLDHLAGHFRERGIRAGDTIYVTAVQNGELYLAGRIQVGDVVSPAEASARLGRSVLDAPDHIIAVEPITRLAFDRRVPEDVARSLSLADGRGLQFESATVYRVAEDGLRGAAPLTDADAERLDRVLEAYAERKDPDWDIAPGDVIERKLLHKRFGGRTQGGIGPSAKTPHIFLFSDPAAGEQHGYFDGWRNDGCFHYTGEGQRGDQVMKSGNAAVLTHVADGRSLRLFRGARGPVTYEDEFIVDPNAPYYTTDAPETGGGPVRKVIVFRLRPRTISVPPSESTLDTIVEPGVAEIPVEEQWTEMAFVAPNREPYEAERREQKLVNALKAHLEAQGHHVCRLKILPPGEAKPLFSDLFDSSANLLVEAKGTVERGAVRMAIGQLADYRRFVDPTPRLAVLLPERPRDDLVALLTAEGISIIWPEHGSFRDTADERA